ncbi:hypothetical protein Pmani_022891 [Petrolisthes manimaculis]|uniref:Uncharacterized protein n=1 Tax=Petrolisthes manimaculis TaxID=1843537 RepID=A0AAE1PDL9_9EUCA|nr:hypothetical protein Pmani_022891 [Petrolisthes manimaculis]
MTGIVVTSSGTIRSDSRSLRCGRRDKVSQHGRVCAKQFSQEQYARDFKSELLNIPSPRNQRRLKCEAIPDLHLPCKQDASKVANDQAQRYTKRSGRRILEYA